MEIKHLGVSLSIRRFWGKRGKREAEKGVGKRRERDWQQRSVL